METCSPQDGFIDFRERKLAHTKPLQYTDMSLRKNPLRLNLKQQIASMYFLTVVDS